MQYEHSNDVNDNITAVAEERKGSKGALMITKVQT